MVRAGLEGQARGRFYQQRRLERGQAGHAHDTLHPGDAAQHALGQPGPDAFQHQGFGAR